MVGAGAVCAAALVWLTVLCVYDLRERRLPNALTLPGALIVLVVAAVTGRGVAAALGAAALTACYAVAHVVSPAGMGAGDVKLALGIGALTGAFGPDVWALAALGAPLLTAVLAIASVVFRGPASVPHGPSMCVASVAAVALAII